MQKFKIWNYDGNIQTFQGDVGVSTNDVFTDEEEVEDEEEVNENDQGGLEFSKVKLFLFFIYVLFSVLARPF